jgi:hypothetical protein
MRASNTERTNETLISFAKGFFGKDKVVMPLSTDESNKVLEVCI